MRLSWQSGRPLSSRPGVERLLDRHEVAPGRRISFHDLLAPQRLHDVGGEQERIFPDLAEEERAGHAAEAAALLAELCPELNQFLGRPVAEKAAEAAVGSRYAHHPGGVLAHALNLRAVAD